MSDAPTLPLARVKKIAKCDPEVKSISANGNVLMAKATEMFIEKLAKDAYERTVEHKRKVVKVDDVASAIEDNEDDFFSFLSDHLDAIAPNRGQAPSGGKRQSKLV